MRASLFMISIVALYGTGCVSGSVTFPYSPVPVLLSRVQHVGEGSGGDIGGSDTGGDVQQVALADESRPAERVVADYRARAGTNAVTFVGFDRESDGYQTRSTARERTTTSIVDSGSLTAELLQSLESGQGEPSIDLQLDDVDVWSYSCFQFGVITRGFRGAPRGQVVSR